MSVAVFFSIVAAAVCGYGFWRWKRVSSMRRWRKSAARIVKIEEQERFTTIKGMRVPYFVPKLEVAYEVGGREYRSDRFSIHNFTIGTKGEIGEVLGGAKVGDAVDLFYDPASPERASLRVPGYDAVVLCLFLGGGLLALVLLLSFAS
jgi:hypothetical protein